MCMHIRIYMVKVISLSEKAYSNLKKIKGAKESFSDVVLKLIGSNKPSIFEFAGMFKEDHELDKIFQEVHKDRKKFATREVSFD